MKQLLSFLGLLCYCIAIMGQTAKKPTIMILPSDNWCAQRYFTTNFSNQGTNVKVPNYQLAFTEDLELPQVISKVGGVLTELGYSIKDAEMELKNLNTRMAEANTTPSKTSGASVVESPLDILKRKVKSDIIIQIWWNLNRESKGRSVSFTLEAFDAYTSKRIATSTGTTKASDANIPVILEKAIEENITNCNNTIENSEIKSEINKANKLKNKLIKQLEEIKEYDVILAHVANQKIEIDLDDGVKENYKKFQNVEVSKEGHKTKKINLLKKI